MSEASEMFWKAGGGRIIPTGDSGAYQLLSQAAGKWRQAGKYLSAGFAMTEAIRAAWGNGELLQASALAALEDYKRSFATEHPCSSEGLLSLFKRLQLWMHINEGPIRNGLWEELANRLLTCYSENPHADSYLVRGFILRGNLEEPWEAIFPAGEVNPEFQTGGIGFIDINLPSAFYIFILLADYQGAYAITERLPETFISPGLRGWKAAVRGFVCPGQAIERFAEAAEEFSKDVMPASLDSGGWTSRNIELWANYFRSRSALASVTRYPNRTAEFVRQAGSLVQAASTVWRNRTVTRYKILVQTLANLLGEEPGLTPEKARQQFLQEANFFGTEPIDEVSLRFLSLAGQAFEGFRKDPAKELMNGSLSKAIETLGRIPLIDTAVTETISPVIAEQALKEIQGEDRTWVIRTLEGIKNEATLRKIILRLLQASPSPPAYGQIRHGPLEFGKDVVALLEENGRWILRMYQAKCGDITTPVWRTARAQLEEIFLEDISPLQLPHNCDCREGILICNGHALGQVETTMSKWFGLERKDHGHVYSFMHVDRLVNWIYSQRLFSTFRNACAELGLTLAQSAPQRKRRVPSKKKRAKNGKRLSSKVKSKQSKRRTKAKAGSSRRGRK